MAGPGVLGQGWAEAKTQHDPGGELWRDLVCWGSAGQRSRPSSIAAPLAATCILVA